MAKSISYKKTTKESIIVKGVLSPDTTTISYVEDKIEKVVRVQDLVDKFASQAVTFSIKTQSDEELDIDDDIDLDEDN